MQGVLCLILLASVGLAGLVTHERRLGRASRLAGMRYVQGVGVSLPSGWILEQSDRGPVLFVAHEADSPDHKGRRILIKRWQVDPITTAEEFLQGSGLLDGTMRLIAADPSINGGLPLTVAGDRGVMLVVKRPVGGFLFLGPTGYVTELVAGSVRPSGLALSLQLDCPDDSDIQDNQQTLEDIATSMVVTDSGSGQ